MKKKITIGTRGSKLALIYAKIAEKNINKFKSRFSIKSVSIKKVITKGDKFKIKDFLILVEKVYLQKKLKMNF